MENDDLYCSESSLNSSSSSSLKSYIVSFDREARVLKENKQWCFAGYLARREIGVELARERMWIESTLAFSDRTQNYVRSIPGRFSKDFYTRFRARKIHERVKFNVPINSDGETLWFSCPNKES